MFAVEAAGAKNVRPAERKQEGPEPGPAACHPCAAGARARSAHSAQNDQVSDIYI
jgi:hypothetical protein